MAGRTVGSVSVTVVPDASKFSSLLRAQIVPQANTLGQGLGDTIGKQIAQGIRQGIISGMAQGTAGAGGAGRAAGDAYGGEFDRAVRTKIEAALRSLPPINIGVATTEAEQKIKDIAIELRALGDQRIGVDVGADEALRKIQELRDRLLVLAQTAPNIQVKTDALAALAQLQEALLKADEVGAKNPTIKVDVDDAGAKAKLAEDAAAADSAGSGFSGMLASGIALGPALIPVIAAITAAMIGLVSVIGAVGAGIGVLGLAFGGVSRALKDLSGEQQRQQTQAGATGRSAASSAAAQISAAAALKQAEESLKNTRANAADAAVKSAQQVSNAKKAEEAAEKSAADAVVAATDRVTQARDRLATDMANSAQAIIQASQAQAQAERTLADAQVRATDAQQALTDARQAAKIQQEDLNNQVIDGINAQRQAELSLQTAGQNLANVTAPGSIATDQQRSQAQLDYDDAIQRLSELKLQNQRLADQKAESDRVGIEGSSQVTQAQRNLAAANQAVIDANQKVTDSAAAVGKAQHDAAVLQLKDNQLITDATAGVVKAQLDGAARIKAAQQGITDALRAQATQQRQSAFSIEQALASVASAQRGLATAGAGGGGGGGGGSPFDKYAADLKTLSPAVIEFATFIREQLIPRFHQLQGDAAKGLLPGVEAGIKVLLPYFPDLEKFVFRVASAMGHLFLEASKALTSPFWRDFGTFISSKAAPVLETFAKIIGNLAIGFFGLVKAFFPVTTSIGDGLLGMSRSFAKFGEAAGNPDSPFQKFIRYVQETGPTVVATFGHIFGAITALVEGLAPYGAKVLGFIKVIAKLLQDLGPGVIGPVVETIGGFFLIFQGFKGVTNLTEKLSGALKFLRLEALLPILGAVGPVIVIVAAAGLIFYELYKHVKVVHDFVDTYLLPVFRKVADYFTTTVLPILKKVGEEALKGIQDGIGHVAAAIKENKPELETLAGIFIAFVNFVVEKVIPLLGPLLRVAFEGLGLIIATFVTGAGTIVDVFSAIAEAAQGNWDKVLEYWTKGIHSVISLVNEFIGAINKIPGVSIPLIPQVPLYTAPSTSKPAPGGPGHGKAFSGGGVMPGYAPGHDTMLARLSPGEAILVPELVRVLGTDWVHGANNWAMGGRGRSGNGSPGHYSVGGVLDGIGNAASGVASGIVDIGKGILGAPEHAAINLAERSARFAVDHAGLPTEFRKIVENTINVIGDSFKFSSGGIVPGGGFSMSAPRGVTFDGGGSVSSRSSLYQLHVHNNRRDIGGSEVVTALNQMHATHGEPLLMGGN